MAVRYKHTQIGYAILGTTLAGLGLGVFPLLLLSHSMRDVGLWLSLGILFAATLLFSSLTIRIKDDTLIWYFGPRFWRNTLPLSSIERVEVVRNSPWHGWGIRMIEKGWLYNVSGLDAVEIETSDHEIIRLGTDEPDRLAHALRRSAPRFPSSPSLPEE